MKGSLRLIILAVWVVCFVFVMYAFSNTGTTKKVDCYDKYGSVIKELSCESNQMNFEGYNEVTKINLFIVTIFVIVCPGLAMFDYLMDGELL